MSEPEENPFESIVAAIAFSPYDWNEHHRLAWIYGIVCDWKESLPDVAKKHGWDKAAVARLKRLQANYEKQLRTKGTETV